MVTQNTLTEKNHPQKEIHNTRQKKDKICDQPQRRKKKSKSSPNIVEHLSERFNFMCCFVFIYFNHRAIGTNIFLQTVQ